MIASLSGRLAAADAESAVIDVGGVGYAAFCSSRTLGAMPPVGEPAELFVETYVRDDRILLYGFSGPAEREWFRLLVKVQGVGARTALGVLSALPPGELAAVIAAQDRAALRGVPGIGPKAAGRILAELKDHAEAGGGAPPTPHRAAAAPAGAGPAAEAVSALVNLGYGRAEAHAAVARAGAADGASLEGLIRRGLRELAAP